jgi:hypothetical protein
MNGDFFDHFLLLSHNGFYFFDVAFLRFNFQFRQFSKSAISFFAVIIEVFLCYILNFIPIDRLFGYCHTIPDSSGFCFILILIVSIFFPSSRFWFPLPLKFGSLFHLVFFLKVAMVLSKRTFPTNFFWHD